MGEQRRAAERGATPWEPPDDYEQTVRRVNPGYELAFTLSLARLRALDAPDLALLVVGAGGGMEVATFAPDNPGWRLWGVDPSEAMLARAQAKADALGLTDRVKLVRGTVGELPPEPCYDAATCLFVLHLLADDAERLALLRGVASRLRPGAPLILASGIREPDGGFGLFAGAWQRYGELRGMPSADMAAHIARIGSRPAGVSEARCLALLREAGFATATRFFSAFTMMGWIAR